jgi:ABC-2 type transport system ATP-binding protein
MSESFAGAGGSTRRKTIDIVCAIKEKLGQLRSTKRVTVTANGAHIKATAFPRTAGDGDFTREVIEATRSWQVEELHTEEGRLDEVFRSITMPDTKA